MPRCGAPLSGCRRRSARPEDLGDASLLQRGDVLARDDAAAEDQHVGRAALSQQLDDAREERHVRPRMDRQTDHIDVFGGSMGVVAGEKIARAFERAIDRRAAVVALTATGGARMQEGMVALTQMAKTITARRALTVAGLPFVAYLRNPTTGGVYASFASLADVLWAEPGATVGFAGPRLAAQDAPLPKGSHTAEFSYSNGLIDDIVRPEDLRGMVGVFLRAT